MPVVRELKLDEYRDRRSRRLRLSEALNGLEPSRQAVLEHLVQIGNLCGAGRVATVWMDESGGGMVHPHVVLDHASDQPRRTFSAEPLLQAWEIGVPGAHDQASWSGATVPGTLAISLGSDGARAWFIFAESAGSRPRLETPVRQQIMFLAGECAAVVLHRDLESAAGGTGSGEGIPFSGWPILEDLEGRERDDEEGRLIARRFVVGRLVRMLIDQGLAVPKDQLVERVGRVRAELAAETSSGGEESESRWAHVLDAVEHENYGVLAVLMLELGEAAEARGHTHGALEFFQCAHDVAVAIGEARVAARAASVSGRVLRRRAEWERARKWYTGAREIARAAGDDGVAARAMVGLAVVRKELGNLPAAREELTAALTVAQTSDDPDAVARVHHGLLGVEQALGNVRQGLQHGWLAVAASRTDSTRIGILASLAAALMECGDRPAAEDAWTLVAHVSKDRYYQAYAHDALGHLCALRGDAAGFRSHSERCDALNWEAGGSGSAVADILYHRGLSYAALGEREDAGAWLTRAIEFAAGHRYNQILFEAEEALAALTRSAEADPPPATRAPATPTELREGLRTMRRELVSSGA